MTDHPTYDGAPGFEIGVACGGCDTFSPVGHTFCPYCGNSLALEPPPVGKLEAPPAAPRPLSAPAPERPGAPSDLAPTLHAPKTNVEPPRALYPSPADDGTGGVGEEDPLEQAKYYVCNSCMTPVPSGHKFCGRCGAGVPEEVLNMQVDFFSEMQDPERARVVVIRGGEDEGLSYHLKANEHVVGKTGQIQFENDEFVSPTHANLFYRDGHLFVRDEQSVNGVFVRVRGAVPIAPGDLFIAGEQLFRLDPTPKASDAAEADGTFFYSSPKYPSAFRINQILEGGAMGMTVCTRGTELHIGREDGDLNFPGDIFMSAKHCTVAEKDGKYTLTDHDSRNGTYIRIKSEQALSHGDYLFIGSKLLRVEINSN